jgi:glucan 1,3-beta-glucosidase
VRIPSALGRVSLSSRLTRYILQVFAWCRKYGLRVNLDLHNVPGSANGRIVLLIAVLKLTSHATGYNHGGKLGEFNFLNGVMGMANAQRTMDYLRFITEFISQPQYKDVVVMFGVINEPRVPTTGASTLKSLYVSSSLLFPFVLINPQTLATLRHTT